MRVAVTGGSGVVGGELVRLLVAEGHEVVALSRSAQSDRPLLEAGAIPSRGDVTIPSSLDAFLEGAAWVFHVAGRNEMCGADLDGMRTVNVTGTENVLRAAERHGVSRLVHTSSVVTLGEGHDEVGDESTVRSRTPMSDYELTKWEAEELVLSDRHDIEVVVVNPSSVQGPGRAEGTGALLAAALRGRLWVAFDGVLSIVDIRDCAEGHLRAMELGEPGSRYVLSGETTSTRGLVRLMNDITGTDRRPLYLRPSLVRAVAPLVAGISKALGRRPLLCPEAAQVLTATHRYDGSKATRELGLVYRPLRETLVDLADWLETRET